MTTNTVTSSTNGIIALALGVLAAGLVLMVLTGRDVPIVGNGAGALLVVVLPLFGVHLPRMADTRSAVLALAAAHWPNRARASLAPAE